MAVASAEDVQTALGRTFTSVQEEQVEWWLTGVEYVIRGRLGDLAELDQDVLLYVEAEAVAAKFNRAGRSESRVTVAVDDGSVSRYYDTVTADDVTSEWWNLLSPLNTGSAYTIQVKSPRDIA